MTREEKQKAIGALKISSPVMAMTNKEFNDYILTINQVMDWIDQEPRWIPVSERLPDTDDEVLCWYEYYHWSQEKVLPEYGIGCYFKETSAWYGEVAIGRDVRVIAWMPLPKPYKAESEVLNGDDD